MKLKEFETIQQKIAEIFPESTYTATINDRGEHLTVKFVIDEALTGSQLLQLHRLGELELKRSGKGIRIFLVIVKTHIGFDATDYSRTVFKAETFDRINSAVAKFYPQGDNDEAEQEGDLSAIGEKVCSILGYLG